MDPVYYTMGDKEHAMVHIPIGGAVPAHAHEHVLIMEGPPQHLVGKEVLITPRGNQPSAVRLRVTKVEHFDRNPPYDSYYLYGYPIFGPGDEGPMELHFSSAYIEQLYEI